MAAAAIIVTILWLNAGQRNDAAEQTVSSQPGVEDAADLTTAEDAESPDAAPVAASGETFRWPVDKMDSFTTVMAFYDSAASEADREAALIEHDNTFFPHTAIDLARKDGQEFEVVAAMSGKVTAAEQTPANGYEVRIQHDNGYETVYQSLKELKVEAGQEVEQGDLIGTAGQSSIEADKGIHVHFEIRKNGTAVNPASMIKED
jgi:stage II sporulation protein Q